MNKFWNQTGNRGRRKWFCTKYQNKKLYIECENVRKIEIQKDFYIFFIDYTEGYNN